MPGTVISRRGPKKSIRRSETHFGRVTMTASSDMDQTNERAVYDTTAELCIINEAHVAAAIRNDDPEARAFLEHAFRDGVSVCEARAQREVRRAMFEWAGQPHRIRILPCYPKGSSVPRFDPPSRDLGVEPQTSVNLELMRRRRCQRQVDPFELLVVQPGRSASRRLLRARRQSSATAAQLHADAPAVGQES